MPRMHGTEVAKGLGRISASEDNICFRIC